MSRTEEIAIAGAVQNPDNPRHFMRVKPVNRKVRILRGGEVLAETAKAVRVLEVGKDLYDPVLYLPKSDVVAPINGNTQKTHCPLKGDAGYFDLIDANGTVVQENIAWCYQSPFDFAQDLAGRVAFYTDKVTVEESPL